MAPGRFNAQKGYKRPTPVQRDAGARTINRAGGEAFAQSPELALASHMLTSFVKGQAYRSASAEIEDLVDVLTQVDPTFAARAALYARREGLRTITHVLAAELAHYADKPWAEQVKGSRWLRPFFAAVVQRPDDLTEILSYYTAKWGRRPLPHGMREGLARAFAKFDDYQISRYRGEGRALSLVDAVNLLHPKPTGKNASALAALVAGTLRQDETWEAKLSEAGREQSFEHTKQQAKAEAWKELLESGKLGYLALLRNLRNIVDAVDAQTAELAFMQLNDVGRITKAQVFPFQYLTALQAFDTRFPQTQRARDALISAMGLALQNVPSLDGATLIALDVSGSMGDVSLPHSPQASAALFAAALYLRGEDVDFMQFASSAQYVSIPKDASLWNTARRMANGTGGTNFPAIFNNARRRYDTVIILSDMQGWIGFNAPTRAFAEYRRRFEADPAVFCFDVTGYGDMQFPEAGVTCLAGISGNVFDVMQAMREDRQALVNRIWAVPLEGVEPVAALKA